MGILFLLGEGLLPFTFGAMGGNRGSLHHRFASATSNIQTIGEDFAANAVDEDNWNPFKLGICHWEEG